MQSFSILDDAAAKGGYFKDEPSIEPAKEEPAAPSPSANGEPAAPTTPRWSITSLLQVEEPKAEEPAASQLPVEEKRGSFFSGWGVTNDTKAEEPAKEPKEAAAEPENPPGEAAVISAVLSLLLAAPQACRLKTESRYCAQ